MFTAGAYKCFKTRLVELRCGFGELPQRTTKPPDTETGSCEISIADLNVLKSLGVSVGASPEGPSGDLPSRDRQSRQ